MVRFHHTEPPFQSITISRNHDYPLREGITNTFLLDQGVVVREFDKEVHGARWSGR
jgi:hypothetical protein